MFTPFFLFSGPGSTKKILALLRAKLRKSVPFKRMKLMVVGLQVRQSIKMCCCCRLIRVDFIKIVLHSILLFCIVLLYCVLYSTVLYCTLLYYTILYSTVLYCTLLYYTVLYYTMLCSTILYCAVLSYTHL